MEYLQGARALRNDPHGAQVLFAGSVLLASSLFVPLLGHIALAGWQSLVLRRLVRGETGLPPLSLDLESLGKLVAIGFKGFIARLVWFAPPMILLSVLTSCSIVGLSLAVGDSAPGQLAALLAVYGTVLPLFFLVQIPGHFAALRADLAGDLNEGLKRREVVAMTLDMGRTAVLTGAVLALLQIGLALGGLLLCCVGIFPAAVIGWTAHTFVFAELYRRWLSQGGVPIHSLAETNL